MEIAVPSIEHLNNLQCFRVYRNSSWKLNKPISNQFSIDAHNLWKIWIDEIVHERIKIWVDFGVYKFAHTGISNLQRT